jgi:DNA helicase-2/ATP-dependent DNA helicase PcrA
MPNFNLASIEAPPVESPPAASGSIPWSPQQLAVFDAIEQSSDSLRVDAVAGAGKTTTLVEASRRMSGAVQFCAFNKRIADEIKLRVASFPNVQANTLHAIGMRNWRKSVAKLEVDSKKLESLSERLRIPFPLQAFVRGCVGILKGSGVPAESIDFAELQRSVDHYDLSEKLPENLDLSHTDPFEYVRPLLQASIDAAYEGLIDFDDMLYMPLVYGHVAPEFDWVLIDEAQDTNWVRRHLMARMVKPEGRVVAVGDPHQAIYGFTGADSDAMDLITAQFGCRFMPLTTTYRCPKRIVEHARQWVSHITAADSAPEGSLESVEAIDFEKMLVAQTQSLRSQNLPCSAETRSHWSRSRCV